MAQRKKSKRNSAAKRPDGVMLTESFLKGMRRHEALLSSWMDEAEAEYKRIGRRCELLRQVNVAAAICQRAFREFPDLVGKFSEALAIESPNPPPNGREVAVARQLVEERILDDLDSACEDGGAIAVQADGSLRIAGGMKALMAVVVPDHVRENLEDPEPTSAPPGSPRKVEVMRERVEQGQETFCESDADLSRAATVERANGSGKQVLELEEVEE